MTAEIPMNDDQMPVDPFGAPDEMVTMMRGISQLYSAAIISGLPEHVAMNFITGVFCTLMQQGIQANPSPVAEEGKPE